MGIQQAVSANLEVPVAVARYLEVIEDALDAGDVGAARRHLRAVRSSLFGVGFDGPESPLSGGIALTGQEEATLRLLPDGSLSQKDIALALGVSRNTMKTHLKSIYLKLGVHCRAEAIHRARAVGLLPMPLRLSPPPLSVVDVDLVDVVCA